MAGNPAIHRIALGISLLLICSISFYQGYTNAINDDSSVITANGVVVPKIKNSQTTNAADCLPHANPDEMNKFRQRVDGRVKMELDRLPKSFSSSSSKIVDDGQSSKRAESPLFPDTLKSFAAGALRVSRDDLMKSYDVGVPFKKVPGEEQHALILYNSQNALPSNRELNHAAVHGSKEGDGSIAKSTVSEAMERCDTFNVVFLPLKAPNGPGLNECYSLIGNFESYHINRWMRIPEFTEQNKKERQLNKELPLRHIGRITKANGINEFDLPELWKRGEKGFLLQHFDALRTFLENVDTVLKDLKNLLDDRKVVKNNTVVVLTVNKGQSELLSNFICSARSRGFDVGNILVFPTDLESKALSEGLGVATYYDEKNLGALPSGEAKMYGDPIFAAMMYAKILCVVYPSLLGLDVLFQDVDIVWYKDPLTYFHDESNTEIQNFDVLFQHDGSAQARYNPLSANSGFYYVRANKRTQYLFTSLLYHGGLVRKSKSHQQVLVQLLQEHSNMFGLNVKVFDKVDTDMFPGGFHYHQDWDTIRSIIKGESNAYILHMSWTENKANKLLFFRQMGEWYVHDKCIGDGMTSLIADAGAVKDSGLIDQCCSVEPIFSCHYSDKPSKIPCLHSPKIDQQRGKLFWK